MSNRKLYSERMGKKHNLDDLKDGFIVVYNKLREKKYFHQAAGFIGFSGWLYEGIWGKDRSGFIFLETGIKNSYPFIDNIKKWDEMELFTIIEFLYDYVSVEYNLGDGTYSYENKLARAEYIANINKLLGVYKNGYELRENGEIYEKIPSGLDNLINIEIKTTDPKHLDERIKPAINKFLKYGSTLDDKKDAIRNLADVLEFLQKQNIKLPSKDDSDLFNIINGFDIRHNRQLQQGEYDKEIVYNWMFYTFLSSIHYLLEINNKYKLT